VPRERSSFPNRAFLIADGENVGTCIGNEFRLASYYGRQTKIVSLLELLSGSEIMSCSDYGRFTDINDDERRM